ncbi:MAG: NADH-quinone oxidoreductase subunit NuoF [Candidatus Dormibacteria bacterium]
MAERRLLTEHFGTAGLQTIDVYQRLGGYAALRKAVGQMTPEDVAAEVTASRIVGRGGAGFPTGRKWSLLANVFPRYVICNADESEPGCFKDRHLIDNNPHQVIEGLLIAAYAVAANIAFIYIRGEYHDQRLTLERAVAEARAAGLIGSRVAGSDFACDVIVHGGAGAYICGEETALIDSLEGFRGQPRLKPPYYPAVKGLYMKPTVVNNVETLSNLPHIINRGGAWFAGIGTESSTGTRVWCCSGHINRPGCYELENGTPIRELLEEHCGGVWKGRALKAFQPGGGSMQVLLPQHLDLPLDMNAVRDAGSSLGAGAMVFMDETTCLVDVSMRLVDFYQHESCGKCAPCREGTYFESELMHRLEAGEATLAELGTLADICDNMNGKCFCPLGDTATWFVMSAFAAFREEFESHCGAGRCPVRAAAAPLVTA